MITPLAIYKVNGDRERAWVKISPDLRILRHCGATLTDEPESPYDIEIRAEWSEKEFEYEIADLRLNRTKGSPAITGESLRSVPVQALLRRALEALIQVEIDDGSAISMLSVLDDEMARDVASRGPKPETLLWTARVYQAARIRLEPPTREVTRVFGIPHRTASYWIRLARDRGILEA